MNAKTLSAFTPLLLQLVSICSAAERVPWTSSKIHGSPEPPSPYRVERAFPKITFEKPMDVAVIPGTDRLVVSTLKGELFSLANDDGCEKADFFGDVRKFHPEAADSFAFTFHPRFAENRFVFVWLNLDGRGKKNRDDGTLIVRFRVTEENPPQIDIASGKTIYSWMSGGHNGGGLRFGPDGMLYVAAGDTADPDPPDPRATGQDIGDVLASVQRIDVDHPDAGRAYGIPKDNPFVTTPGARGEVWAYGFRNPWRLAFDQKNGALWVGDVGWELWEMIDRVERGGNYGWSITEGGKQEVRPDRVRGPSPILPPTFVHSHKEAASVTGGEVYYGKKLPELDGHYLYGDWQLGTFWALRDGKSTELCRSNLEPIVFGVAPDGEIITADYANGGLWRFARNPDAGKVSQFPRRLSESGLFADVKKQTPAPGVVPFKTHAPRWADHATSERWLALPGNENITLAKKELGVIGLGRWVFPDDAVLAKTYTLETERGNPATTRKVETQIMHFDGIQWAAYSYRWNDAQTDAELVLADGADATFDIKDPAEPSGALRQPWHFFARAECLRCHNMWNNFTPGFSTAELDRKFIAAAGDPLELLQRLNLPPEEPKVADPHDANADLEIRARSYLHTNCATCHRFGGGGSVPSRLTIDTPLADARLIDVKPVQGDLGIPNARIIAPGDPYRSVLLYRMATAGRGHMPYLGGKLIDDRGLLLVRDWIASMKRDGEPITGSPLACAFGIIDGTLKGPARAQAISTGAALTDPMQRELFARFLPESQRRKVLGPDIQADSLLALTGDAARGKTLFTAICAACHRAGDAGIDFGPELTHIAAKYERPKLLEQILQPAKIIEPQWHLATVALKKGDTLSGFIAARTASEITLKLAGGESRKIPADQIEKATTTAISLMPEGLLQSLTVQEAADLLAFVSSLQ